MDKRHPGDERARREEIKDTSAIAAINMTVDFDDLAANTDTYLDTFNKIFNK